MIPLMAVYVDRLIAWGWKLRGHETKSCHMLADTLDELHDMAQKIGMKRTWFQDTAFAPHYDLTPARRARAIELGAVELTRATLRDALRAARLSRVSHG